MKIVVRRVLLQYLLVLFAIFNQSAWSTESGVNEEVNEAINEEVDKAADVDLKSLSLQLASVKLSRLEPLLLQLEGVGKEAVLPMFEAITNNQLYYIRSDKRSVIIHRSADELTISDALSGESLGGVAKSDIKKVRSSNKIRKGLRAAIARLTLFSADKSLRSMAVINILNSLNVNNVVLLERAREQERDADILANIEMALAVNTLKNSSDADARLAALDTVDNSLQPIVRAQLQEVISKDDEGNYREVDAVVLNKAQSVLKRIEGKIKFYGFIEKLFFGLSLGSVLLLVATGLAITFGVMGVINMAHGELIMLGAYTTYVIQLLMPNHIEYSVLLAIPAAFLVSGSVGVLIERGVIQFLHGRPLETLLATFGISLVLQQAVRSIFSPLNRQVETPAWMSGSLEINSVLSVTYNRLYIFLFALLVFALLQLVLKKTSLGLNVRAVSQNRDMAKAIGIRTEWVDAMTFGLGSGIAGIAGVALSQLTNVGPNLGQSYIIDSFMVVVFGGVGNLWGTLVGGFTLGIANKFLEPATGAVLANIIVLVFIILFIQKRPRGLFPQKGRAAD